MNRSRLVVLAGAILFFSWMGCEAGKITTEPGDEPVVQQDTTKTDKVTDSGADAPPADRVADKVDTPDPTKPDATATEKKAESTTEPTPEVTPEPPPTKNYTYWKDTKAIFETNCVGCHYQGGIGPFGLGDYKQVSQYKALIKVEVAAKRMPPWQGAPGCNTYTNDFSLKPDELKAIVTWIEQGAPEGDPKDYVKPPPVPSVKLSRIDVSLKMKKPYTIKRKPDEYRCFVIDWPGKKTQFISGFQVTPGNPSIVHHVITYLAPPGKTSYYTNRDPNGDGYSCFGVSGGPASYSWVGVWAPGLPGTEYAKDTGIKVEPGSKIIVQVHYNVTAQTGNDTDQTTVDFKLEDSVKQEAILLPFADYIKWLFQNDMKIPKDDANVTHEYEGDVISLLNLLKLQFPKLVPPSTFTIHSIMHHMHQLGKSGKLSLNQDGKDQCLFDIPRWDFNWQTIVHLKNPVFVKAGTKLKISCSWDNSQKNQPFVDGKQQQSQDVNWGDGSNQEMCLGVLYITCGDKAGKTVPCPVIAEYL